MKLLPRTLLPLIALLALARPPEAPAQAIELKQRWITGKKYFQKMETAQQSAFEIGPQKMDQQMKMTMEMTMAVTMAEDKTRQRVTLRYERAAMEMTMNGQKMGFDSAQPAAGTDPLGLNKTMGAVVGKEMKMLVDAKGEVVAIENYEAFIAALGTSPVPGMDMRMMFSEESLRQTMKGALQSFPPQAVAPGATWPFVNEMTLPQIGKVGVRGTYKFNALVDRGGAKCAELATDATLTMDMSAPGGAGGAAEAIAALGMKVTDGTLKGTVWFDPALGMTREAQLVQDMKMSMKNPLDPAALVVIPMKQTITTTLTKVEDLK